MILTQPMQAIKKFLPPITVLVTLVALVTAFWAPTLFSHKTVIHGDSILHSLSLWEYFSRNVGNYDNLIWDRYTYGGHPLFAEGQGGFIFPLKVLLASNIDPVFANNFAHWLEMILAGLGAYGLGRTLKLSHWASGFAAIGLVFSSYWVLLQQNMTLGTAAMCIPWMLWAGECWIQRPSWRSGLLFGLTAALSVFAGYPHCLHGSIIYILILVLTTLSDKNSRIQWRARSPIIFKTGLLAVGVGIGLAAVQLLPLLELTNYSHRAHGTVAPLFKLPFSLFTRGLLYNLHANEFDTPNYFPVIGSALICVLFSLGVFFRLPARIKSHAWASIFLLTLGMGGAFPLTQFLYHHHLIPGMHYFRLMFPYFLIANTGICLVAAHNIDHLTKAIQRIIDERRAAIFSWLNRHKFKLLITVLLWLTVLVAAQVDVAATLKHWAIVGAGCAGIALAILTKRISAIPPLLFAVLTAETAFLKLHEYQFADIAALAKPSSVKVIEAEDPSHQYKLYSSSTSYFYALGNAINQKNIAHSAEVMLAHICGLSSVRWNLLSMMGSLALPLHEWVLIDPILFSEATGKSDSPIGSRLIDVLAVKFIVADGPVDTSSFSLKFHDPANNTWLIENAAAKPRFQTYSNFAFVNSPEEALQVLHTANSSILALEIPKFVDRKLLAATPIPAATLANNSQIQFTLKKDEPTDYQLNIKAERAGWLFLADANYPGWQAYIDGKETAVFTGQILGKAIAIPVGEHQLELRFTSKSFLWGRNISLFTLVFILFGLALVKLRQKQHDRIEPLRSTNTTAQ